MRRIVETDVQSLAHFSDKGRTAFVGPAANRDDVVPLLIQISVDVCRNVCADVDAHFCGVTPNGMPPLTNPMKRGIDEHEQNGVMAPKIEASRY